ncbi:MAG TPA: hypothetical protein VE978_12675 [Chitinophagales bacterium]|nr:hypothetical protein [Chitinophagales bacterium]
MKTLMKKFYQFAITLILLVITQISWAQDQTSTTTHSETHTTTETWYVPVWGWAIGGAVLLIIIIALISRRGRTDKVIVKHES